MGDASMAPASNVPLQAAPIPPQPTPMRSADSRLQLPASCDPPGPHNPSEQCVWVIFGATGHIGRAVALAAIAHNDPVTAVGRAHQETISEIQSNIPNQPPDRLLPTLCDVRVRSTIDAVIGESLNHWGRIDIIVNCTGYGIIGACEDQDEWDIRNQFEVGFWGTVNILHASLGYFRTRPQAPSPPASNSSDRESILEEEEPKGGRYLIFSNTSGALGVPGLGPYSATKHAVEGLIESMLYETHAFNIKATLVEPGLLHQDTLDPHNGVREEQIPFSHFVTKQPPLISAYTDPNAPAGHAQRMFQWLGSGNTQPTSTVRSAELVWQLGHCRFPPLRLALGQFAVESVRDRLRCVIEEIEDWKHLGFGEEGEEVSGAGGQEVAYGAGGEVADVGEEGDVVKEQVDAVEAVTGGGGKG